MDKPIKVVKDCKITPARRARKDWQDAPRRVPCGGGVRIIRKALSK
jgi:hypothetical protein